MDNPDDFDYADNILSYFYIAECIIKIIGLGFSKYFDDGWNIFDFTMVILSLFGSILSSILSLLKSAKSAKTTKLLRLTKLNKIFKVFRAIRTIKTLNFLSIGVDTFN